jgi:hypothetical protein
MKLEYNVYEIKLYHPIFVNRIIFSLDLVDGILDIFKQLQSLHYNCTYKHKNKLLIQNTNNKVYGIGKFVH